MNDRPNICPECLAKSRDMHGMIFAADGKPLHRCQNTWHLPENYDPSVLKLTPKDREFLKSLNIECE